MFARIIQWVREVLQKMLGTTDLKRVVGSEIAITPLMQNALQLWSQMYVNQASWLNADVKSLNLSAAIAGEISRAVTIEMEVEISGSPRAEFLQKQFEKVMPKLRQQVEYGNAKGGLMLKPYAKDGVLAVDYIQADQFFPVSFDVNGNISACVFADQRKIGTWYYTRLEYHDFSGNSCTIRNRAFRSQTPDTLGNEVALSSVQEWADITPEATVTNIQQPLFAYFKTPFANNIDPTSPLGVSCYARAVDLIRQADEQWSRFLWEFESGNRALYADVLAFDQDKDGKPILPLKRLYRTLKNIAQIGKEGKLFDEWSPTLREVSLLNGLDAILKKIEFSCGLAYGTISDPEAIEKTATEIISSKQRSQATVVDTQKALEVALNQLLYAMDTWATIYRLAKPGTYIAKYQFDDSIVTDYDAQFTQDSQTVGMSAMSKQRFLIRNYGLTETEAKEWVEEAQAEQPEPLFPEEGA